MRIVFFFLLAIAVPVLPAPGQQTSVNSSQTEAISSSAEMQRLFEEDQAARQKPPLSRTEGVSLYRQDVARRIAVRALVDQGALHTAQDFENAAFIFQHGDTADDYLLAHTLAIIAVAKGRASALWIATATLDRYLNKIGQPQIYGTQYLRHPDATWTQEPYNRALISDAMRQQLGVPPLAAQEKQLEEYKMPSK